MDKEGTSNLILNCYIGNRNKYIELTYYHIEDGIESGKLTVLDMTSYDNLAYLYTMPLPGCCLSCLIDSVLGMVDTCHLYWLVVLGTS